MRFNKFQVKLWLNENKDIISLLETFCEQFVRNRQQVDLHVHVIERYIENKSVSF